ncbi:hypothetical protein ACPEEZ_14430 [Frigoribacterium sp. 2-23]|uniref:hypothetical protein n=1 Tax=Frigoribacterium sp. 2-23 TaxID=3415006 RepID=UPI003C6F7E13
MSTRTTLNARTTRTTREADTAQAARPVAVLLPGTGYTVQAPLLSWCGRLLAERGWHVEPVSWTIPADLDQAPDPDQAVAQQREFVEHALEAAFASAPPASRRLVVAKSFGSWALPWAVAHDVPGVWLTPVLVEPGIRDALSRASSAHLALGGGADPLWRPDLLTAPEARVETIPEADHALALPRSGWRDSYEVQRRAFELVDAHVARL